MTTETRGGLSMRLWAVPGFRTFFVSLNILLLALPLASTAEENTNSKSSQPTSGLATPQSIPRTTVTNREEILEGLSNGVVEIEKILANPATDGKMRERIEKHLGRTRAMIEYFKTNDFKPIRLGVEVDTANNVSNAIYNGHFNPVEIPGGVTPVPISKPERIVRMPGAGVSSEVSNFMAAAAARRANPRAALTNRPDVIELVLSQSVDNYERQLEQSNLSPSLRAVYERLLSQRKKDLADHQTNAQLWTDLDVARASKIPASTTNAERKLADYLAARIGKPPGMSLDAVMKDYEKRTGNSGWRGSGTIVRFLILAIILLPPVVLLVLALKKKRA